MTPTKLLTLLQRTLLGVATELQTEKRTDEVNTKAVLLAQQIMCEVKTDRQVKHEPRSAQRISHSAISVNIHYRSVY